MEWHIEYIPEIALLYIKTKGILTNEKANQMVAEIALAMKEHQCLCQIVDHRETVFDFRTLDYYERPKVNQQLGMSKQWRVAMIFKQLSEETLFMETVFRNRGFEFRQFDDLDKAKEWVLKK
ncbi:MAG TPA: hypothetical protein PLL95_02275 [Anaerolineales bacterium]|nr:hypothetical protein [Anaerolineales bacterium]